MSALLAAAAKPVVVQVQEASGGASIESILVFIAGVLAAIGAVVAAIITTRGASSRLEQQLASERERFDKQVKAEASRTEEQLNHDRYLARRAEASATVERITRLVARSVIKFEGLMGILLKEKTSDDEDGDLGPYLAEIREETAVVAVRFGNKSPLVAKMSALLLAMQTALPDHSDLPLDEQKKAEVQARAAKVNDASASYLVEAKKALDQY